VLAIDVGKQRTITNLTHDFPRTVIKL